MLAEPTTASHQELFKQFLAAEIEKTPQWEMVLKEARLNEEKTRETGKFYIQVPQIYAGMCNKLVAPVLFERHNMVCVFEPLPENHTPPPDDPRPLEQVWWDALNTFLSNHPSDRRTFKDARFVSTSTKKNIIVELPDVSISHGNRVLHQIRHNLPRYNGELPHITFVDQNHSQELEQEREMEWSNFSPVEMAKAIQATRPTPPAVVAPPPPEPDYPPKTPPPAKPPASAADGHVHVGLVSLDPTRGYIPTSHYGVRFWQPLLGLQAYSFWQVLRSYGHFVKQGRMEWPTIEILVETLGSGSRHTILGRNASGNRPEQKGLVAELVEARLCRHWTTGESRRLTHHFDVLDELPLLSPVQVAALPSRKQAEHETFLRYFRAFGYDSWASITAPTCIPEWWL